MIHQWHDHAPAEEAEDDRQHHEEVNNYVEGFNEVPVVDDDLDFTLFDDNDL